MVKNMKTGNKGQLAVQLNDAIKEALGSVLDPKGEANRFHFAQDLHGNNVARHFDDALAKVIGKVKVRDLVEGAIQSVGDDLARELEKTAITRGVKGEVSRSTHGMVDGADVDAHIAQRLGDQHKAGDLPSQILPAKANPKDIARRMVEQNPGDKGVQARAATIAGYEKLDADLVGADGWAKPSVKTAIEGHIKARNAFFADDILSNLVRLQKTAYVPRNLRSIINNYMSNEALQWLSRANPVSTAVRLSRARNYSNWLEGKVVSDADHAMFDAIKRSGIVDSNRLAQDIGVLSGFDPGSKIPIISAINKALEKGFKMGDDIFKIDEAITNYKDVSKNLGKLGEGRKFTLPAGGKLWEFSKKDGKIHIRDLHSPTKQVPHAASTRKLNDAIAAVSVESAARKFMDFSRVPGGLEKLKASPFRGLGSGFATWFIKAVDLPGKPGLLHASLTAPLKYVTNDPGMLRRLALQDTNVAIRRAAIIEATHDSVTSEDAQKLGKLFRYGVAGNRVGLTTMIDQDHVANMDWNGVDYTAPTKLVGRTALSIFLNLRHGGTEKAALDAAVADGADPTKWKAYTRLLVKDATGQLASPGESLALIALSGSTIKDTLDKIKESEEAGKVITIGDVIKITLTPFVGSTAASAITTSAEGVKELNDYSTGRPSKSRIRTMTDTPATSKSYLRWAFKEMAGKGWNVKLASDAAYTKPYSPYAKYKREWLAGLGVAEDKKAGLALAAAGHRLGNKAMEKRGEAMVSRAEEIKGEVAQIIAEMFDRNDRISNAMSKRPKK